MLTALRKHWPEYLMEAAGLGIFMISACIVGRILNYPASPVRQAIPDPVVRRVLGGITMGLTAISIVYSPWGKQSGAHLNPSLTLTFFRLGKVEAKDTFFYVVSQFVGGLAGVLLCAAVIGRPIRYPSVNYVVTVPGVHCAKLHHQNNKRCIFCEYQRGKEAWESPATAFKAAAGY